MELLKVATACVPLLLTSCVAPMQSPPTPDGPFVVATYDVPPERHPEFLAVLQKAERVMRSEGLISPWPAIRMRSQATPSMILEVFQWTGGDSFEKAQRHPLVLEQWQTLEVLWTTGGFGLDQIPESHQPWARFDSLH